MAARTSSVYANRVEYAFWLVFDENGNMRFARTEPSCNRGEHKMAMTAALPRSLWRTPQLRGAITLADQGAPAIQIDIEAAQAALKSVTGLDIDLRVIGLADGET